MPTRPTSKEITDNLNLCKKADKENREAYRENTQYLTGDQWNPVEAQKRRNKRLMLTADMLNAPVDQIVNSVRQNRPGPVVSPIADADSDDAEIMAGLLRRIDYENNAWVAHETAMENATGGNFGCWGVDLEYENNRSWTRRIKVRSIPNANETVYFDPSAIKPDRSDAEFAFELMVLTPDQYKRAFPNSEGVKRNKYSNTFNKAISSFFGSFGNDALAGWINEDGIQVARYWKIEHEDDTLRLYSNGISYWDSEKRDGKIPERDDRGKQIVEDTSKNPRQIDHRILMCYMTNGAEILGEYPWPIDVIPLYPVYGRERWLRGKRLIFSMIQLAKQAQQAFNFAFTGACEILSQTTKAPWIGLLGQFKSKLSQWQKSNVELQAYLEFDEVYLKDGKSYTTPPQRAFNEPPIQGFLQFCTMCVNAIQRATSVFDPSLGRQKAEQSGRAIEELDKQSSEGNFHWSDNLTITLTHYYRSLMRLIQTEYDAAMVTSILHPDMKTSIPVTINKLFPTGKKDSTGRDIMRKYNIAEGQFALSVSIGKAYPDQRAADIAKIDTLVSNLPPELFSQCADIIVKLQDLGPMGNDLAARLTPPAYRDMSDPRSMAASLAQSAQTNKQLMALVQKLHFDLSAKIPQIEADKYKTLINAIAGIREAEIKAGVDKAQQDLDTMEHITGLAHEVASDALNRQHTEKIAKMQQDAAQIANQNQGETDDTTSE